MDSEDGILAEQVAYYDARAGEYDEWFLRTGRYDHGDDHRARWSAEVETVRAAVAAAKPSGAVLELACGTGLWTAHLAPTATTLTCVDASRKVIALNRSRLCNPTINYVQADLFRWEPPTTYDFIFFGFWLSHVPASQFESFWLMLRRALRPGGRVFLVDSLAAPDMTAHEQRIELGGTVERRLNDGRTFRIVKIFHTPATLTSALAGLGWQTTLDATPNFFLYGGVGRQPGAP